MNAFECWQEQRDSLRAALKDQSSMADVAYAVRHALLQTEQNALAEQSDAVPRQQMGVLFSMAKNSIGFLDMPVTTATWIPQSRREKPKSGKLTLAAFSGLCMLTCGLLCYFKGVLLGWVSALLALLLGSAALIAARKKNGQEQSKDEVRVTVSPDCDKLLNALDAQMRSIDRCMNDFTYLNETLRDDGKSGNTAMAGRVADLLEALYECDPEERAPAEDAVRQMLSGMGLKALDYSEESRKLFTALPSKNETRTLTPAIVNAEDYRLLKRGTAAVKTDAA
ncbi:MAG: hypothetical protein PHI98_13905 [Eubacteriales bacterium]|nr:hypothetical protein [Eubacteriales bacterium]